MGVGERRHGARDIQIARVAYGVPRIERFKLYKIVAIRFDGIRQFIEQTTALGCRSMAAIAGAGRAAGAA